MHIFWAWPEVLAHWWLGESNGPIAISEWSFLDRKCTCRMIPSPHLMTSQRRVLNRLGTNIWQRCWLPRFDYTTIDGLSSSCAKHNLTTPQLKNKVQAKLWNTIQYSRARTEALSGVKMFLSFESAQVHDAFYFW